MVETISREVDNAWLAGFLEGEGCLIARFYNSDRRRGQQFFVRVTFTNNNALIMKKVSHILSDMGVGYYYQLLKRKSERHNTTLVITVQGKGRVRKLLNNVLPYMSGKLHQARVMLDLINRREEMAHCYNRGEFIDKDETLNKLINELSIAKHLLPINPSETTRIANRPLVW